MGEHVVLSVVDPLLIAPATLQPQHGNDVGEYDKLKKDDDEEDADDDEEDLIQMVECRICQEEDTLQNLDTPCACTGSLKPFKPGYTATSPVYHPRDTSIDISEDGATSSNPLNLHDSQLLAFASVEHQVLENEHDEYVYTGTTGTTLWHSVGLIFLFLRAAAVILPCYLMARIIRIIQDQRQRQVTTLKQLKNLHLCYMQRNSKASNLQYHQVLLFTD
ncbi:hypothetical protein Fmac_008707 [Flemingia macrophylla]|uniref:RING-CH-type domain-containing protein n=1 Tax=Flemingia macrophylla TaxID=520843 RepID=A0ABD1MY53_9FABA